VAAMLLMAASASLMLTVIAAPVPVTRTSSTQAAVLGTARSDRSSLSTSYNGPASCATQGFLTGDNIGDANPLALYRTLCPPVSSNP
jgi:hypothetical protein